MSKEYFSHDYNPLSDHKMIAMIAKHGAAGYGLFWRIVEMLHENEAHQMPLKKYIFSAIGSALKTDQDIVEELVNDCINEYELFRSDGSSFWSERANRNIEKRAEISGKRSKAGQASAASRVRLTNVQHVLTDVEQNSTKEKKVNKKKGNQSEDSYTHDSAFEKEILSFWGMNEINHFQNFRLTSDFCAALATAGQLDYFKKQFSDYKKLHEAPGKEKYKKGFANFLGKQENAFSDGFWNSENWSERLKADRVCAPSVTQSHENIKPGAGSRGPNEIIAAVSRVAMTPLNDD